MLRRFAMVALAAVSCTAAVRATAQNSELPAFTMLDCGVACPRIVKAKPVDSARPSYPSPDVREFGEAIVRLNYTIGTDGHVKNPIVEEIVGAREFGDASIAAMRDHMYQPATEDGKPVEQNWHTQFVYRIEDSGHAARSEVIEDYTQAAHEIRDGQDADAIATLQKGRRHPQLTLFEQTLLSYPLAQLEAKAGDFAAALGDIRIATLLGGSVIDTSVRADAMRLRIRLEVQSGELAEAYSWLGNLKRMEMLADTDPDAQLVAGLIAKANGPDPLVASGNIPSLDRGAFWIHRLARRDIAFAAIQGKLDKFDLRCDQHGIESPVSDKAEWTVPRAWTGCTIYVSGDPGTKFQFVELQPKA